jgi:DNA-binding MarR family transcriptional regulator
MLASDILLYATCKPEVKSVQTDDELATADVVGTQLMRLVRLLDRKHAQYQADHPDAVERATYILLVHLVKDGPQRAGALAESVHSDPSTVSRQLAQLVKLGLVERTADPEDGRATLVGATVEGLRVFEQNRRNRNAHIAALTADWDAADRHRFADLLSRFTTDFENSKIKIGAAAAVPS